MSCQPPVTYADPRDVAELVEPLRSRVAQLIADAPTGGLVLVSGRRSPWQQWLLRHQRCPGRECDPACKGSPTTALPGRSQHQLGRAADLGGRELSWAGARAHDYGLVRPVPGEPWHFEPAPWAPSVPVRPWGAPAGPGARSWAPVRPGDTDRTVMARSGRDNAVTELQLRLLAISRSWGAPDLEPGPVDGIYGHRSQRAVTAFKLRIIALQRATGQEPWNSADALVGERTWAMLRWWTP
jgi:hypothetical protein